MKSIREKYREFLNTDFGTEIYKAFKQILYSNEDSLVQVLNNDILQGLPVVRKDILQVCDIGGGDGNRITRILRYLHAKFGIRFHLDFVEQSKQYIESFDTRAIERFGDTKKFHDLFEKVVLPGHYDLVFLIHSIFAFESGDAIGKVLSLRSDDGRIIVVSNAPKSFLGGLKSLVDEGYDDKRYEIDALQRDLDCRQIAYTSLSFQTRWAIDKDNFDEDIRTILEWISLGSYQAFSAEKKRSVSEYVAAKTATFGDRIFFTEDEVVIVIPPL